MGGVWGPPLPVSFAHSLFRRGRGIWVWRGSWGFAIASQDSRLGPQLAYNSLENNTMKAIQVTTPGGPEVLQLRDVETPKPGAGQVLVKLSAIGVNYMDVYLRRGDWGGEPPFIPGGEGAGTIEDLGAGVTDFSDGERVAYWGAGSSYAEYVVVPVEKLIRLPEWILDVDAAAFPIQGMTAHYLVHDFAHVGAGTVVLIHAVAGGVGLLATQIAARLSANVFGTTSSEEKAIIAKEAGANEVILYNKIDFADEVLRLTNGVGADLILDGVGKSTFPGNFKAAKIRGTVVIFGSSSGQPDPIAPSSLQARSIKLGGGALANFVRTPEELQARASDVMNGIREGWLKTRIEKTLPLADSAEAHRLLEGRQTSGKLILTV